MEFQLWNPFYIHALVLYLIKESGSRCFTASRSELEPATAARFWSRLLMMSVSGFGLVTASGLVKTVKSVSKSTEETFELE